MLKKLVTIFLIFGSFSGFAETKTFTDLECEFNLRKDNLPLASLEVGDIIIRRKEFLKFAASMKAETLYLVIDRYVNSEQRTILTLAALNSFWLKSFPLHVEDALDHRIYMKVHAGEIAKAEPPVTINLFGKARVVSGGYNETYVTDVVLKAAVPFREKTSLGRGHDERSR